MTGKTGDIWFSSDLHINHDKISEYMPNRPQSIKEMNSVLIDKYLECVKPGDTYYCLGDFGFPARNSDHIHFDVLEHVLPGRKVLIRGNHDKERRNKDDVIAEEHPMWDDVRDYYELKFGKSRFILFHYPLETWRWAQRGAYQLHGHIHSTNYYSSKYSLTHRFDVGVDNAIEFGRPWHIEELREMFQKQNFEPEDHHGD